MKDYPPQVIEILRCLDEGKPIPKKLRVFLPLCEREGLIGYTPWGNGRLLELTPLGEAVLASQAGPLTVTLKDLERITLGRVKVKTMHNHGKKPKPVFKADGLAYRYLYSDWYSNPAEYWPHLEPLPDESEARSRLS